MSTLGGVFSDRVSLYTVAGLDGTFCGGQAALLLMSEPPACDF